MTTSRPSSMVEENALVAEIKSLHLFSQLAALFTGAAEVLIVHYHLTSLTSSSSEIIKYYYSYSILIHCSLANPSHASPFPLPSIIRNERE
jgi:hypothetical protein